MKAEPGRLRLSWIVLAAGHSRRMGAADKLLLPLGETTVIEQTVQALSRAGADTDAILVITGANHHRLAACLVRYPVRLCHNPDHAEGIAASLRTGLQAATADTQAYAVCLGDLPFIRPDTLRHLSATLARNPNRIIRPFFDNRPGHPVLFPLAFRDELLALRGDTGAQAVLAHHPDALLRIEVNDPGVVRDLDTPDDFRV